MNNYKLKYKNKKEAIDDLVTKKVIEIKDGNIHYINGTQAVVWLGELVDIPAVYKEGEMINPPIMLEGYHVDILTKDTIIFKNNIIPKNPKHTFA